MEMSSFGSFARSATVASLLIVLTAVSAFAQQQVSYPELPNFCKVNEHLYRGAQPRTGGVARLSELGIKTIINLRGEDRRTRAEKAEAEAAGLRYIGVPLPAWGRPDYDQVAEVLAIIQEPANWPVFIHCRKGSDRTGTVVACYRISPGGWTVDQAMYEARRNGMHWIQYWMKDFISDYARRNEIERRRFAQLPNKDVVTLDDGLDDKIGSGVRAVELLSHRGHNTVTLFLKRIID